MNWTQKEPAYIYSPFDSMQEKLSAINGIDDLDSFLNPNEHFLHSPYLLDNIDSARDLILDAIYNQKYISIFSDVDSDGCLATAIMFNYLKQFTNNITYFHAQRSDGHSIDYGIDNIPHETELLIIVDSSTGSTESCKKISETGLPILILDHHPKEQDNPYALIVNPQLDNYPNKELSGAGLCWKMIQVLDDALDSNTYLEFVDLAGIGIYGDTMSMLENENRYIVDQAMRNIKNPGVKALLQIGNRDLYNITTTDLGFSLVPMINGSARLDKIEKVLELLTCDGIDTCVELAKDIKQLNEERKLLQKYWIRKLSSQINEEDKVIVLIDDEIGKGFTGLVSAALVNHYGKPVITLSRDDDVYSGSFRSCADFDLKAFLSSVPVANFSAGHSMAGGTGCDVDKLDEFKRCINDKLAEHEFNQQIQFDLELDADEIDEGLINEVLNFTRISGKDIQPVKFKITNLTVTELKMSGQGKNKETANIICGDLFLMKFKTNEEFLNQFSIYDNVEVVGGLSLFKYYHRGLKGWVTRKQIIIEDISKNNS